MTDRREVISVAEAYGAAVLAADVDALMRLYSDDVRVFDTWDRWEYRGAAAWRASVSAWFGGLGEDRVVATFQDVEVGTSAGVAWLTGSVRYAAVSPSGAELRSMHNRLSWVLRDTAEGWRIVHEHTSAPAAGHDGTVILSRPPQE